MADKETEAARMLCEELAKRGIEGEVRRDIYDVPSNVCWQADIDSLQTAYDYVIFNLNAPFLAEWGAAHMLIWASHLFDKKKKVIINYRGPFFAEDYMPEDPTFIEVNCPPTKETVELLVKGLFGELKFTGQSLLKARRKNSCQ